MAAKKRKRAAKPRRKSQGKPPAFAWTQQRIQAAQLLAEDELTDAEIAAKVGIGARQLYEWKARSEFAARVDSIVAALGDRLKRYAIARKSRRLAWLNDRRERLQQVIDERAAHPDMQDAPGGKTGLLVRRQRMLGSGDNATPIAEFEFDAALEKALRETEKQAAQECGQWVVKHAPTDPTGTKEYSGGLTDEQRLAAIRAIEARLHASSAGPHPDGPGDAAG